MDTKKMRNDPRHAILSSLIGEAAKDFILLFEQAHDALDATPHEFVNGAAIQNKLTGKKNIYTLTVTVENDVSEERLNQYAEESIIKENELNKKWDDKQD
jgi:hypothetical protein